MFDAECACPIGDEFDWYWDSKEEKITTDSRNRFCCECHEMIKSGQEFELVVLHMCDAEGDLNCDKIFRTCITCMRIRKDLFQCYEENGHNIQGFLVDYLKEHYGIDFLTEPPEGDDGD